MAWTKAGKLYISPFQFTSKQYTILSLIGAAPGYLGFEEAGQLTEAIRRIHRNSTLQLLNSVSLSNCHSVGRVGKCT